MRGIVFRGGSTLELATFPDPTPGVGEVVLEIKASGMCGSDLHWYRRPAGEVPPVIAGHEPCGVVVAVGPGAVGPHARIGARVMVHHYSGCMGCPDCRSGWPQMCRTAPITVYGTDAHGAHAPYMKVRADTLVPLNERLSFEAGAAISCGTGTAWGAFERIDLSGRDTVAVFGQGPVGLSATMLAKAQGARVIALDIDESRRKTAKEFGADAVINPLDGPVAEAIRELTGGKGVSVALETSGAAAANRDALDSVSPWGTVCLVGIGSEFSLSLAKYLRTQVRILTSWTMSVQGQRACADFVVDRGLNLDALFTDRWRLDQAQEAYQVFNRQSGGKGVFLM
ncbi:zinc-containing alcohol dehydrogenase superfamily protein [Caballeronia arationis]|jgi:threonine dehydrogenase-like Zn-dependent dehydrogenase|uniref:D-arabinose 1-dehydrogenase, Zn-dependent alcohol dehydrogenase family n=2 Tax=Caballeronia TaxID=1827195 RepID=A0A7Z7IF56_9BURK|nr:MULTISPECIES: zinc-binding dehydrogenase [Caballeronia]SAK82426.1 zinc-containing alcohol dehydrogenase superfamily protein [Caballeronia glebae]SAK98162.1 zinc-containing alcohol dehydrogenase superfamily protein [Caballeronia arationis]SOE91349.1 D-arabinose 1-dehydrogenase, Zn-dependent alcohol dehydrogenase family [Caballeronia arationis]